MRFITHGLVALATVILGPIALAVALARPRWRAGLRERLWPPRRPTERPIWIHAASVGEVAAALPLIDALRAEHGPLWLTAQTADGRARLAARCPDEPSRLAPLDHPWITGLAVRRVRPRALVLVETEVWPSLVAAATRRGVPVVVVSGRLSERAFRSQRELAPFFRRTFGRLAAVGARGEADAARFVALGTPRAHVRVTGDLKWAKSTGCEAIAPEILGWIARRPTIVLGSTHPDEESELLAGASEVAALGRDVQWLWAPRHPEDAEGLMRRLAGEGLRAARRSTLGSDGRVDADVLVLDTLGELQAVWPHGLIAVVAGTFGATGGHDLLEPLQAGRPVIFGPSTANVNDVACRLVESGVAIQVRDGAALGREIARLLGATRERADRVARGTALLEAGRAALDANVKLVAEAAQGRLPRARSRPSKRLASTASPSGLYARSGPDVPAPARIALSMASSVYGWAARVDRRTSRLGLRRPAGLPCAVVSVGSWLAGGAAKTPVTIWLANALRERGHRVVVVTRGHGVHLRRRRVEIASHGTGPCAPVDRVGDEALVISRETRDVPVLVARDRHRAGLLAVAEFGCDVLLLDDGYQHFALKRDLDLVCLDAEIGLGNGRVLPAGPLRESKRAWQRADALVVTGGTLRDDDARTIGAHSPELRRFSGERRVRCWREHRSGEALEKNALGGRAVALLAGLADPASFRVLAEAAGVRVGHVELHRDHHAYTRQEIEALGGRSRIWITTAKDASKIDPAWLLPGVELYVLELEWAPPPWPSLARFVGSRCGLNAERTSVDAALETPARYAS